MNAEVQARMHTLDKTLIQLRSSLKAFQESDAKFRVLATVDNSTFEPIQSPDVKTSESPKTLFILDSSYNPPSIAHQSLAERALEHATSNAYAKPHRLLLLFSTMNADKAPSPASFDQRLTLMTILASDLLRKIAAQPADFSVPPVDIGVTTAPYYTDKSLAIEKDGRAWYPDMPRHVHLIGFDTLTRVFAAKYYKDFDPPFSALNPYFDSGHEMRATMRPGDDFASLTDQKSFVDSLRSGKLASDGAKPAWADQVHLVSPNPKAGVSSTNVRSASKAGDWKTVEDLCPPSVARWIESQKLYTE